MSDAAASPAPAGHVVVGGLGRVGYRLVQLLCRLGERVVVISESARDDWLRLAREAGAAVITGDARSSGVLEAAGVTRAAAVIAATDRDAVNLEIALDARQGRADLPVVIRLFDRDPAVMLEERLGVRRALGASTLAGPTLAYAAVGEEVLASFAAGEEPCDVALSTSRLAAPAFVASARHAGVVAAWTEDAARHAITDLPVPPEWDGLTPAEARARHGAAVLFVIPAAGGRPLPAGTAPLRAGQRALAAITRPLAREP
jgi:Trk K+ transport system NAD-binding subunit